MAAIHAERVHAQPVVRTITMKDLKLALANGLDALLPGASRAHAKVLIHLSPISRFLMSLRRKIDIQGGEFLESP